MRTTVHGLVLSVSAVVLTTWLSACPSDDDASDDGGLPDANACMQDSDCRDDGRFCNGGHACVLQVLTTDHGPWRIRTCQPTPAPCAIELCDEAHDSCRCAELDADSDGNQAQACGGTDCDDTDPNRYAANTEVCDAAGHDEDCDPSTFGVRDRDADGFPDATCCNGDVCGSDCDDTRDGVHPTAVEACDGVDNDCDGAIDEGVVVSGYPDEDGDGWGDGDEALICAGLTGYALADGDCDDELSEVHPGSFRCRSGSDIEFCTDRGRWERDTCPGLGLCVPQPDGTGVCLPGDESEQPQCSDGVDNDDDGVSDWSDPQCASPLDNSEGARACADGDDNDHDGLRDFPDDPGCSSLEDTNENDPKTLPACANGLDDDGDGTVDYVGGEGDPGCVSAADDNEREAGGPACDNDFDDDDDDVTDYPDDATCLGPNSDAELTPGCDNGLDDDFDGYIDYPDDPGCLAANDDSERQANGNYACDNGLDDDNDGVADAPADPNCSDAKDTDEAK